MEETPQLSVIAPCLNEEPNISVLAARTLAAFEKIPVPAEIVLVDDGSKDGTWARIQEQAAADPRVRGFHHETNQGIVGGWRTGLAGARGELVCLIDSDLQNRPEDIPRLYRAYVEEKPDIVQGVRHAKVNRNRILFSKGLNFLLNVSFGMDLRDNKSGFLLCRRDLLLDVLRDADGYRIFQSFVGVAGGVRGCRFVEVDTDFDARHAGTSFLSNFPLSFSMRTFGELVRYRYQTIKRPPRPRS